MIIYSYNFICTSNRLLDSIMSNDMLFCNIITSNFKDNFRLIEYK